MPTYTQNKRSSTLNNPPSAGTLDPGEIALNTNADSANLHFEDADGGVRSLGADPSAAGTYVRNVASADAVGTWTELEIPPGTIIDADPPADPADGQLWFNEANQTLWVWRNAENTWAPAVPQVPTGGGGDYTNGELNEKVFFLNEQEVDESYTVTGTDNAGSFGPISIASGKNVTIQDGGSWTVCGGVGKSVDLDGFWSRNVGVLSPATPGDDIESTGDLSIGSITAAGQIITPAAITCGRIKSTDNAQDGANTGFIIRTDRGLEIARAAAGGTGQSLIRGYTTGNSDPVFEVSSTGSITASGDITSTTKIKTSKDSGIKTAVVGGSTTYAFSASNDGGSTRNVEIDYDGNISTSGNITSSTYLANDVSSYGYKLNKSGFIGINKAAGAADGSDMFAISVGTVRKVGILADGSITAAGSLIVQGGLQDPSAGAVAGCKIFASGFITACRASNSNQLWKGFKKDNSTPTSYIQADGNASFKSTYMVNAILELDRDNSANYVSTTNAETGETESVYSGPVIDVKALLLDFQAKIQTLEEAKASLEARISTLEGGN